MTTVLALIGAKALYLLYIWLASGIICSALSLRKGYGEKSGLATGILLSAVGIIVWLLWPAKPDSRWKLQGPFGGRGGAKSVAAARAEMDESP
jgi:hypothetical protein